MGARHTWIASPRFLLYALPFHNFDLSQITDETERINMVMVVQSYIEENFIKKNSTNPNKAKKLIVSTDEAHRILKFEGARNV